jgi:hypothetical protein
VVVNESVTEEGGREGGREGKDRKDSLGSSAKPKFLEVEVVRHREMFKEGELFLFGSNATKSGLSLLLVPLAKLHSLTKLVEFHSF